MEKVTTGTRTGMKLTIQMIRTRFPSAPQMKTEELDRLMKSIEAGNTHRALILLVGENLKATGSPWPNHFPRQNQYKWRIINLMNVIKEIRNFLSV